MKKWFSNYVCTVETQVRIDNFEDVDIFLQFWVVYISKNIQKWDSCNTAKAISLDFYGRLLIGGGGYTVSFFSRQFIMSIHSVNERLISSTKSWWSSWNQFLLLFSKLRIFIYLKLLLSLSWLISHCFSFSKHSQEKLLNNFLSLV